MKNPKLTARESLKKCDCVSVNHSITKERYTMDYMELPRRGSNFELLGLIRKIHGCRSDKERVENELLAELEQYVKWVSSK